LGLCCIQRVQSQFVATNIETYLEWLDKIGCDPEHIAIPCFSFLQVVREVDNGTEVEKRNRHRRRFLTKLRH
jgi:hypothetical protein